MPKEEETTVREVLQVRYGEIFLKGLNRPTFLRMLVDRVRDAVKAVGGHVWLSDGRIYVSDAADMDEAIRRVTKVFGVHSVCRAIEMEKDSFEALCAQAAKLMEGYQGTFKVNARRSDKRYPMDSPTISAGASAGAQGGREKPGGRAFGGDPRPGLPVYPSHSRGGRHAGRVQRQGYAAAFRRH